MNTTILRTFTLPILFSSGLYAQDIKDDTQVLLTDQDKFITLSQIDNSVRQTTADRSSVAGGVNTVFIQQIGTGNAVFSTINAVSSDIKIFQNGIENKVEINEAALEIQKRITQTGDNNTVIDVSSNRDISTSLDLIQEGNHLIFERFGTNELSKNLKFRMSGDARTIIVRSF